MIERDLQTLASGAVRDTTEGKVNWLNCLDNPMWERYAAHMTKAEATKGRRNWMKVGDDPATAEEELERGRESLLRHVLQFLMGHDDEDHGAAAIFNMGWITLVEAKIAARAQGEEYRPGRRLYAEGTYTEGCGWRWTGESRGGTYTEGCGCTCPTTPAPFSGAPVAACEVSDVDPICGEKDCTCPRLTFAHDYTYRELVDKGVRPSCAARVKGITKAAVVTDTGLDENGDAHPYKHVSVDTDRIDTGDWSPGPAGESRGAQMRRELQERGSLGPSGSGDGSHKEEGRS